jgi:hypothetical protein
VAVGFKATALLVFRGGDAFAACDGNTREAIGILLIQMHFSHPAVPGQKVAVF